MKIQVRFFASLREALGAQDTVELPEGSTVAVLRDQLLERGGRYAEVLAPTRAVRCAVNQAMASDTTVIEDGAEVAFFPPVTGG
jgi:molybdopterin synthase sulfur carrier subunit